MVAFTGSSGSSHPTGDYGAGMAADPPMEPLTLDEIRAAAARIAPEAVRTPVVSSPALDRVIGARVLAKVEAEQRSGSFKFRGAYHRLSIIPEADRPAGVVAVSSGNHGAAVATAAGLLGLVAHVFVPEDAPAVKRGIIEEAGATLHTFSRTIDDREAPARALASQLGATFVHPFEDRAVMAGQGTAALELFEQVGDLDALIVPMSGGGLMAGCGSAMRALVPGCRLIGVEPAAADDTRRSFEAGHPVTIDPPSTVADGLSVRAPGINTFAINRRLVDEIRTVTEDEILAAVELVAETLDVVVEPSGAVGIAALVSGGVDGIPVGSGDGLPAGAGPRVGVILSGGNTDRR